MFRHLGLLAAVLLWLSASALAKGPYENFKSEVRGVTPPVPGVELSVLGGDEQIELRNESGKTVVVEGYDEEPYLGFKPGGTVERNLRSPATYLNADRSGLERVPASAKPRSEPEWRVISKDGSFRWYDHRIHVTTTGGVPKRFREATERKKVFDWAIPISVNGKPARAQGTLFYEPDSSSDGAPVGLIIAGAAAALVLLAGLFFTLRRRGRMPRERGRATEEAW